MTDMRILVLVVLLGLTACGSAGASATRSSPSASASNATTPSGASPTTAINCSTTTSGALTVLARNLVYDVSDPVHPRLVCRGSNTQIQLAGRTSIAYVTAKNGKALVMRRELATGAETLAGNLPFDPRNGFATWTPDGLLEAYAADQNIHLWSGGADHVLYSIPPFFGGFESRWSSPRGIAAFSPNGTYLAFADPVDTSSQNLRIFSIGDRRQLLVVGIGYAQGGRWLPGDRFVWAGNSVMQWSPSGGAHSMRSDRWFDPVASADGNWLAATVVSSTSVPHVLVVTFDGTKSFSTQLGSSPSFVSATIFWYAEEKACGSTCAADPTLPDGVLRAFDVLSGKDAVVQFAAGELPGVST